MKFWTAQIAVANKLGFSILDFRYVDISVESGDKTFAPTQAMVNAYKEGRWSQKKYADEYYKLMRKSYKENFPRWEEIFSKPEVIIACSCKAGEFCHRYILKDIFIKLGAEYVEEIEEWKEK